MTRSPSPATSSKRRKLDDSAEDRDVEDAVDTDDDEGENNCSICLQAVVNRTVIPKCSHEFCFECLLVWTEQSRRCPLCSQGIGEYLIHSIRSRYDYRKHFLLPLQSSPTSRPASQRTLPSQVIRRPTRQSRRPRVWGTREGRDRDAEESDKLERSIVRRRWIYEHDLYAKHIASNSFTKFKPYPTPSQFAGSQDLISRTTTFLRRELQIWEGLDVEFLTTLILSLMKSIDIRSESAVKLISEFLDMDEPYTPGGRHRNADHFAHEVYSYVRSPYKDLFVYDSVAQYDQPEGVPPPPSLEESRRWRPSSNHESYQRRSPYSRGRRAPSRQRSPSSERSTSWSPSGRRYSPRPHCHDPYKNEQRSRSRDRSLSRSAKTHSSEQITSNMKGKAKAASVEVDAESDTDASPALLPDDVPVVTEGSTSNINGASSSKPSRPPRRITLLDSVKAHLKSHSQLAQHHSITKPTEPTLRIRGAASAKSPTCLPVHASDQPCNVSIPSDDLATCGGPSTPITSASPEPPAALANKEVLDGDQTDTHLASLESRARLLARLNREKREAADHARSPAATELQAKEATLRARARLQTKLAAEKRLSERAEPHVEGRTGQIGLSGLRR